jgi:hypothetical protein
MFPETEGPKDKETGTTETPACSRASEIQPDSNREGTEANVRLFVGDIRDIRDGVSLSLHNLQSHFYAVIGIFQRNSQYPHFP